MLRFQQLSVKAFWLSWAIRCLGAPVGNTPLSRDNDLVLGCIAEVRSRRVADIEFAELPSPNQPLKNAFECQQPSAYFAKRDYGN